MPLLGKEDATERMREEAEYREEEERKHRARKAATEKSEEGFWVR